MTIAISLKVGEGLVLAADSTATYGEEIGGQFVVQQSYHHAQKLIRIKDYPIGVLTYGLGTIGKRNLESFIGEFEVDLPEIGINPGYTVEQIARNFYDFLRPRYDAAHPPSPPGQPDQRPRIGVVIGGYLDRTYFPDEFEFILPGADLNRARAVPETDFGIRWWGDQDPIFRLYFGVDSGIVKWAEDRGLPNADALALYAELRQRFAWPIIFESMPLQDAIDLAVYFVNVTIGRSRFVVGPAICGGHVDVAVITHRGFTWVRRKQWSVKADSVFFRAVLATWLILIHLNSRN